MKPATRRPASASRAPAIAAPKPSHWWKYLLGFFVLLFVVLEVYQPALNGPFLFDDLYLPFTLPELQSQPLVNWLRGVRPVLMLSYWFNYRVSGLDPYSYHLLNFVFHAAAGSLVYLILLRLLTWSGETGWKRHWLAIFGAGVFLLHPLQTEAVSYVASRSEALTVMLMYGAFAVFLYRKREAIGYVEAVGVLALFGLAVLSKEYAAALPALLILTDYFFGGFSFAAIKRNWRLYLPLVVLGAAGLAFVWRILRLADTAGFGMKDLAWYEYFFTQCRAIWVYLRLFVLPYGQSVDYEFALSRSIFEHGAIVGLLALIAVTSAAVVFRKKYPLACYGFLAFLLLIAPTSSFVPIKDPLVERRLYLPSIGLILIAIEGVRRLRIKNTHAIAGGAALLVVLSILTYNRNQVWSSTIEFWKDTADKAPQKVRPRFQLAYAYYEAGQCSTAVEEYSKAAAKSPPDRMLLLNWGLAYDCTQQYDLAFEKLNRAAAIQADAHVLATIGMIHAKQGKRAEAFEVLDKAEKLDSGFDMTFAYRGNLYLLSGEHARAAQEFRRALALNPKNAVAQRGLTTALSAGPQTQ